MKTFICLSGLPRSGSTLLSSILSQNPAIHAEGNSGLCQIMWDTLNSCQSSAREQLSATGRYEKTTHDILNTLPSIYYKDVECPIVIDKCRSWTMPANVDILKRFIGDVKIICLERPIGDIVKSFINLAIKNNWSEERIKVFEQDLLRPESEPIMRSLFGLNWAKKNDEGNFIFIKYDEIVTNPKQVIDKIYKFCNIPFFEHDFTNIINKHPENDQVYNMIGQHEVRNTIEKRKITVELSAETLDKIKNL
jgi:sulfotransferase